MQLILFSVLVFSVALPRRNWDAEGQQYREYLAATGQPVPAPSSAHSRARGPPTMPATAGTAATVPATAMPVTAATAI